MKTALIMAAGGNGKRAINGNFRTLEEIADFYIKLYTSRTIVVVIFGQMVNDVW